MSEKLIEMLEALGITEEVETKVRVGRISKELQEEMEANRAEHDAEHQAIKAKIDAYIEKVTKNHSCDKFHDKRLELWEKAYDELGFTEAERGLRYTVANGTRVVFRMDDAEENKNSFIQ